MKVLFITQYFLPYNTGGTELYLLNLCKHLKIQKIDCAISCSNPSLNKNEKYVYEEIDVFLTATIDDLKSDVSYLIKNEDYNIVHIHTMGGNINNQFLKYLKNISVQIIFTPHLVENLCLNQGRLMYRNTIQCNGYVSQIKCQTCISSVHKEIPFYYKQEWFQIILQKLIPTFISKRLRSEFHFRAKAMTERISLIKKMNIKVISLSKWYLNILKINGLKNVNYIPQAVNESFINTNNVFGKVLDGGFKWVYIGRIGIEKGIDNLIRVFNKNAKSGDKLILFFFIKEPLTEFENTILATIKLNKNILLHANYKSVEIAEILKTCDCLVLPSKVCEMAPLVIQEAFTCKVPVLVSNFVKEKIEEDILGLKFNYSIEDDFENKFNLMRNVKNKNQFIGIDKYKSYSFYDVANNHIELYKNFSI